MRIGSLFSGAAGLDMAVEEVFGGHTVWHSEIDPAASKVLAHRFPNTPNLGDITSVEWADVPEVDVLCGGFPCQDVSAAGKRAGIKDGRRERVFIVASAADAPRDGWHQGRPESARLIGGSDAALRCDEAAVELLPTPSAADGGGGHLNRSGERGGELLLPGIARAHATGDLVPTPRSSDCFGAGAHGDGGMDLRTFVIENASQWGKYAPAIARWEAVLGRPAPPPTEPNRNGKPRLSAAFSEWLMGWPEGWVTGPDIGISRNNQLRIVGNGVVPRQAAAALRYLLAVCEVSA